MFGRRDRDRVSGLLGDVCIECLATFRSCREDTYRDSRPCCDGCRRSDTHGVMRLNSGLTPEVLTAYQMLPAPTNQEDTMPSERMERAHDEFMAEQYERENPQDVSTQEAAEAVAAGYLDPRVNRLAAEPHPERDEVPARPAIRLADRLGWRFRYAYPTGGTEVAELMAVNRDRVRENAYALFEGAQRMVWVNPASIVEWLSPPQKPTAEGTPMPTHPHPRVAERYSALAFLSVERLAEVVAEVEILDDVTGAPLLGPEDHHKIARDVRRYVLGQLQNLVAQL